MQVCLPNPVIFSETEKYILDDQSLDPSNLPPVGQICCFSYGQAGCWDPFVVVGHHLQSLDVIFPRMRIVDSKTLLFGTDKTREPIYKQFNWKENCTCKPTSWHEYCKCGYEKKRSESYEAEFKQVPSDYKYNVINLRFPQDAHVGFLENTAHIPIEPLRSDYTNRRRPRSDQDDKEDQSPNKRRKTEEMKTTKVVVHTDYGGFSVSQKVELKMKELGYLGSTDNLRAIERHNPFLVQAVEELDEPFTIVEIPTRLVKYYQVKEYDGMEWLVCNWDRFIQDRLAELTPETIDLWKTDVKWMIEQWKSSSGAKLLEMN